MSELVRWTSEAGLECSVRDCRGSHLCGYVRIPVTHPLNGVGYNKDIVSLPEMMEGHQSEVGVIAFAMESLDRMNRPDRGDDGIIRMDCAFDVHGGITFSGALYDQSDWWIGFDCGHLCDEGASKDESFVRGECEKFAGQLARYADALSEIRGDSAATQLDAEVAKGVADAHD